MLSLRSFRAFLLRHEQIRKVFVENPSRVSLVQSSITCFEYSKSLVVPGSEVARRANPRGGKATLPSQDVELNSVHIKYQQVVLSVGKVLL